MKFLFSQLAYLLSDPQARRNLIGLAKYLVFLAAVIVAFSLLFHVLMLHEGRTFSWLTGFYWTLTVMSTLGFGDITFASDLGRFFSIVVLVTGIVLLLIVLPFAFIRFFYAPWLEAQIRTRAPRRAEDTLKDHVIICQRDAITLGLTERLAMVGIPHLIIEPDAAQAAELHGNDVPVMAGEVDSAATYEAARVEHARAVFVNIDDETNTNVALTVREKSPSVMIIATADSSESQAVLELAGTTHVLPLKQRLGEQLAARISANRCEAHVIGRFRDLLIAEFPVQKTPLAGLTLRETKLRETTGVNVVGVWERGRLASARPDTRLSDTSVPVVVGTSEQIGKLNLQVAAFETNPHPVLVIGAGKVGGAAIRALRQRGVPVHVIERDPVVAAQFEGVAEQVFVGSASNRELLEQAGLGRAPSVLLTMNEDATNIFLCIFCRKLNPGVRIVSRITHERNVEAIHRAGADFVLSYASLGQESVLALVQNSELIFIGEGLKFFSIETPLSLLGKSLRESAIGAKTGLNVVAIQRGDTIISNPSANAILEAGSELLTIGSSEQRRQFKAIFN